MDEKQKADLIEEFVGESECPEADAVLRSNFRLFLDFLIEKGLIVSLLFLVGCGDTPRNHFATTPKGISIWASEPIPADVLPICDRQVDDLLEKARAHGLNDTRSHRALSIKIDPRSSQCEAAAFLVHSHCSGPGCYDGTEWDKEPREGVVSICAAGQYVESEDLIKVTMDGVRTTDIVRFEGEHWLLYHADRQWYERTKFHTPETGHPILR